MRIPVRNVLPQDLGYRQAYAIADELPELGDVVLAQPMSGEAMVVRTSAGVAVSATLSTRQALECHRCLRAYEFDQTIKVSGEFSRQPQGDQLLIDRDIMIDLTPLIREELILGVPMKQSCGLDCPGPVGG
jgi:uncharacterized metal-binding protein YceD (DUF177 family)